jgi:predicted secreted protein
MATDGWDQVKTAFVALWRRVHPERAEMVAAELTEARLEVLSARQARDGQAESELVGEWRSRLQRLVAADQQLEQELRRLVEEFRPSLAEAQAIGTSSVRMRAKASGRSRVNQAGRDQTVVEG